MPKRTNISSPVVASEARQTSAVARGSGLQRRLSAPRDDGQLLSHFIFHPQQQAQLI